MDKQLYFCHLECVNFDIRVTILAAIDSFDDLSSLIRASPTFVRTFISRKPAVLLSVVSNILGPATRDAALLAITSRFTGDDFDRQIDEIVREYQVRLDVAGTPSVNAIDMETAVSLTHVTRLTQFCVEVFGYFHCRYFAHEMEEAADGAILPEKACVSQAECGRIAQAIIRRQILGLISGGVYWTPRDYPGFMRAITPLFQPWEWQQISDMDGFLGLFLQSLQHYQMHQGQGVNWDAWHIKYAADLDAYVARLKNDLKSGKSVVDFICKEGKLFTASISIQGTWNFLRVSHQFYTDILSKEQRFYSDDSCRARPWGWEDALHGQATCRWGLDLVKMQSQNNGNRQQDYEQAKTALKSWRWFGMVFWDQERIENLKGFKELQKCQSGWLVPWQD